MRVALLMAACCLLAGPLALPPLAARTEDIPLLAQRFLDKLSVARDKMVSGISSQVLERLTAFDYPGNIRELRNILYIAATHSTNCCIDAGTVSKVMQSMPQCQHADVPETAAVQQDGILHSKQTAGVARAGSLSEVESQYIESLLKQYDGNRKKIAVALGVSERTVYRKLKRLSLN